MTGNLREIKLVSYLLEFVVEKLEKVGTDVVNETITMSKLEDEIFNIKDIIDACGQSASEVADKIEKSETLKLFNELMGINK